jgi:hypothetical protein
VISSFFVGGFLFGMGGGCIQTKSRSLFSERLLRIRLFGIIFQFNLPLQRSRLLALLGNHLCRK